jgi:non-homologous end joining protein Ku
LVWDSAGQPSTAADQQIRGTAVEMLKKKRTGISTQREHAKPRPQNVVNVIDALRRSVA